MSGTARARTVLATALCCGGGALLLPWALQPLLGVPPEQMPWLVLGYLAGAALMTLGVALTAWVALWPATPYLDLQPHEQEPRGAEPREARAALLVFPARVATAGAGSGMLAVVAGWLALTVAGEPASLVLGLSLCTTALVGLSWSLLYTLAQRAAQPLLSRLRDAPPPPGHLVGGPTLRGRLCLTLLSVVAAGVVPAAVLAATYLERTAAAQERLHSEHLGRWLTLATRGLSPRAAEQLIEAAPLSQGYATSLGAGERGAAPLLVVPGGKAYQAPPRSPGERPLGLALAAGAVLLLTALLSLRLGSVVSRDLLTLLAQVRSYTETPPREARAGRVVTAEAQPVEEALGRLMDRMRRLHVDSYLAIERTIDARRAKSQFLASMSHDLRSPLSSVLGFAELLTSGYDGAIPEAARRRLLRVHRTGRHLLRILSEILDTAKVESQTIELHPRRCTPAELLAQAIADARRGRSQEDIPVTLDIMPGLRPIQVDPVRFPQALAHLIGHVLDSAGPGEPRLRVTAREGRADSGPTFEVEVEVERLSLRAIPADVLPPGTAGLGLALPLARRLIALHGGTIEVSPGPRPGVRAVVPLKAASGPPQPQTPP